MKLLWKRDYSESELFLKHYSNSKSRRENKLLLQSRCGSLANTSHTPGGGKVKIESKR